MDTTHTLVPFRIGRQNFPLGYPSNRDLALELPPSGPRVPVHGADRVGSVAQFPKKAATRQRRRLAYSVHVLESQVPQMLEMPIRHSRSLLGGQ